MNRTRTLEQAVIAALNGHSATAEAERAGLPVEHLRELADRYRAAGRTVLEPGAENWLQINLTFVDYLAAESVMLDAVWPILRRLDIDRWWFIRKHPHWRLRLRPTADNTSAALLNQVADELEPVVGRRIIDSWSIARYEPEIAAFGGIQGIRAVHDLFHADSQGYLEYRASSRSGPSRSPDPSLVSLLVTTHVLRAVGIETTEHGDVWARIAEQRPPATAGSLTPGLASNVSKALQVDLRELTVTDPSFSSIEGWAMNIDQCGRAFGNLWRAGDLDAGVRGILARIVIFHWNRIGLDVRRQSLLAAAACDATLRRAD